MEIPAQIVVFAGPAAGCIPDLVRSLFARISWAAELRLHAFFVVLA
jgi:hypothetical protein